MRDKNKKQLLDESSVTTKKGESRFAVPSESPRSCCSEDSVNNLEQDAVVNESGGTETDATVSFTVDGMSCVSCAREIEKALNGLPEVSAVRVNFSRREAVVILNKNVSPSLDDLRAAVEAKGYQLLDERKGPGDLGEGQDHSTGVRPYLIGLAASLGVVGFYLGLLTLTSDWYNARLEFKEYGIWILTLALGLGVQATLFSFHRARCRGESLRAAKYSLAASGGMSTTAMAACCAHYLVIILPAIGLPFLSAAAAGLATYQVYFFMAGVISNLFGIGMMIRMMRRSGMIQWQFSMSRLPLYFRKVNDKGGI